MRGLFFPVGVTASMEVMCPVEEEPFEISLDNYGCQGGPKAGRLRALANVNTFPLHPIFHNMVFMAYFERLMGNIWC